MTDSCRFHCTVPHDYLQILMTFMTSNSEKKISAEVRLIHAEQMSLYDFIVLRKNNRHSWRLNKPSKTFQINGNLLVFLNCKVLLCLRNKNFLTEIYRNIQTFAFKVLQKCSSWASRNGAAQMFFLTPNRNMLGGKFVKSERFLTVLREHIIFNFKWVRLFEQNCSVEWVIFFASFC